MKTIVIGAGPVGSLAALYAAKRGDDVELYELRNDLRIPTTVPLNFTKSINLALSERGINSIREAKYDGLLDQILGETIPMYGRMIHGKKNGTLFEQSQFYDAYGRFIRASDRADLNKTLLDKLESLPNVKLCFNHKLSGADFKRNKAWFECQDKPLEVKDAVRQRYTEIEVQFDLMIGADGAHSAARQQLMKYERMAYHQEYIDTLWCEFNMRPLADEKAGHNGFVTHPNRLHIWPGSHRMFIAIPSVDRSFTCTAFMPVADFEALEKNPKDLLPFFEKNFPGVVPEHISAEQLQADFLQNPHLPLLSIKCEPYTHGSSVVIVGDAAHAMVPFYGQGMNAGLEDVRVLYDILDKHPVSKEGRTAALAEYTETRAPDAHTINDLAMGNFREMRADVQSPFYLLRKNIEEALYVYMPRLGFATQYSRVSFSNQRYSEVAERAKWQGEVLKTVGGLATGLTVLGAGTLGWIAWTRYGDRLLK